MQRFREDFSHDRSVVVMMKYPDHNAASLQDAELLWEHVCIYMLGSRYGLALPFEIDEAKKLNRKSLSASLQNWLGDLGVPPREQVA